MEDSTVLTLTQHQSFTRPWHGVVKVLRACMLHILDIVTPSNAELTGSSTAGPLLGSASEEKPLSVVIPEHVKEGLG